MGDQMNGAPRHFSVNLVAFDLGMCAGMRAYRKLAVYDAGGTFDPANADDVCWTEQ